MATLYAYRRCSTCRKALQWLEDRRIAHTVQDLKESPPSAAVLRAVMERSGLPLKRFFNTSGQSYRGGGWKDKVDALTLEEAATALAADGMLIKRPLLVTDSTILVGFKAEAWEGALG